MLSLKASQQGAPDDRVTCRSPRVLRALLVVAVGSLLTLGSAQVQHEDLATVQREESRDLRGIVIRNVPHNPELELHLLCAGAGSGREYGFVDTNRDGRPDLIRQYGAAMVSASQYEQAGPRLYSPLRVEATARARGAIANAISVTIGVNEGFVNTFDLSGDDVEELRQTHEEVRTSTEQVLLGSMVTGVRIVSLGDGNGVCLVVRYDAPLHLTPLSLTGEETVSPPAPRPSAPRDASDPDDTSPKYEVPDRGTAGDF